MMFLFVWWWDILLGDGGVGEENEGVMRWVGCTLLGVKLWTWKSRFQSRIQYKQVRLTENCLSPWLISFNILWQILISYLHLCLLLIALVSNKHDDNFCSFVNQPVDKFFVAVHVPVRCTGLEGKKSCHSYFCVPEHWTSIVLVSKEWTTTQDLLSWQLT